MDRQADDSAMELPHTRTSHARSNVTHNITRESLATELWDPLGLIRIPHMHTVTQERGDSGCREQDRKLKGR